jgi:hypothetical protein
MCIVLLRNDTERKGVFEYAVLLPRGSKVQGRFVNCGHSWAQDCGIY